MMRLRHSMIPVCALVVWFTVVPLHGQNGSSDRDGDGLTDAQEETLGTDPGFAERFVTVLEEGEESAERRAQEDYDAGKDVVTVESAHAGDDRFVWRVGFAGTPTPENTVLHLYVDADSDSGTGRKGNPSTPSTGTEFMLSVIGGHGRATAYAPDGSPGTAPVVSAVAAGRSIILSADVPVGRDAAGAHYSLYVLCHTTTSAEKPRPAMSDGSRKVRVVGVPVSDRPKIRRLTDYTENDGVESTYGLAAVRETLARADVVAVRYDRLEMDGFEVDRFTSRRYGHVKRLRPMGTVGVAAPAGRYHVGFLMYDDGADERVAFQVDGRLKGVAVARVNNYRHWMYWLADAIEFQGGETVTLVGFGPDGKHGIARVLFMPTPPPVQDSPYVIDNVAWYTAPGADGTVTVSWTTSMPTPTRFEYGPTAEYGEQAGADDSMLVHRVVLSGLDPGRTYHGRAVGMTAEGQPYHSADTAFAAKAQAPPPTVTEARRVPLRVRNPHDVAARDWPITMGVPFPRAVLAVPDHVRLLGPDGEADVQVRVAGYWPDNSIKWLLVTFLGTVEAAAEVEYTLEFGRDIRAREAPGTVARAEDSGAVAFAGAAAPFRVSSTGELILPSGEACRFRARLRGGASLESGQAPAHIVVEENGPLKAVVKTTGDLSLADGTPGLRLEQRIEAFRNRPFVRIYHTVVIQGSDEFMRIEEMGMNVPVASESWEVDVAEGDRLLLDARRPRVFQDFDDRLLVSGPEGEVQMDGRRLVGSALASSGSGALVGVRRFWQNYPSAFRRLPDALTVDFCPDFEAGVYDEFPFEKEGHQLYYWLLDGQYSLKRGMAKTHEVLVSLDPAADSREAQAQLFQRPLLAVPPPEWICATNAFYPVAPRNETQFKAYEEAVDANLKRYVDSRERQRDYGMMNFGDWYGERGANWGNIEYDTQHAFILEFIRSGNEDAFFLADETERHNRDIDTVHWDPGGYAVGGVYVHQMGHVGGYYDRSVPGTLGIPKAGFTVSHAWTEGHFNHYFLTGDRRSLETGRQVTDFFARKMLNRPYDFTSCRVPGWHLIMNAAAYAATCDPYYLNASRVIVDRVVETQDPEPRPLPEYQCEPGRTHQTGGWTRMMVPGHCQCIPRHRGNAGFMVAVLLSGLKYYHDVTGEPRVKEAIIRGARYLVEECYSDTVHGFRYTSCPKTGYRAGATPLMVEAIARAYRWTGDEVFRDPLENALPLGARGSGYGKGFSMYYRMAPRLLADLAATGIELNEIKTAARVPFSTPDWMTGAKAEGQIVVQAEDFSAQGGGECQVRDDRHKTWGSMVTYWHKDIGHWLEWTIDVPRTGDYIIRFHYATGSPETARELRIDGAVPREEAEAIRFEHTGGFGHSPTHWQFRSLTDEQGDEVALRLEKGTHTIRMTNLKDGLGLDFLVLVPADHE